MIDKTLSTVLSRLSYSERSLICGVSGVAKSTLERAAEGASIRGASAKRIWQALVESGLAQSPKPSAPLDFEIAPVPEVPHYVTDLYLCPAPGTQGWQVLLTTRVDGNARPVHYNFSPNIYPTPNAAAEAGLRMQAEIEAQHERNRDPRLSPSVFLNQGGGAQ